MPTSDLLWLIDALRARGAVEIEAFGVRAVFAAPKPAETEALEPAAAMERKKRIADAAEKARDLDERLLHPLGIKADR